MSDCCCYIREKPVAWQNWGGCWVTCYITQKPVAWWNRSGCWAAAKTCCLVKLGWMLSNSCIKYHTSTCCLVKFGWMLIDHEPAYTPLRRGILPHGNFWVPWPSKHSFQVVCKWAVAVCVCGAGSNECTIWNSKLRWPCLLATHLLWQKRPFPYIVWLFEQFNML